MDTDKLYAKQLASEYAPKDASKVVALDVRRKARRFNERLSRKRGRGTMHCCENRFCASLTPDVRAKLFQACTKSTYAAGSKATMNS